MAMHRQVHLQSLSLSISISISLSLSPSCGGGHVCEPRTPFCVDVRLPVYVRLSYLSVYRDVQCTMYEFSVQCSLYNLLYNFLCTKNRPYSDDIDVQRKKRKKSHTFTSHNLHPSTLSPTQSHPHM